MISEPPETTTVRPGEELDWPALLSYLRAELGVRGSFSVLQFPGGSANLTYLVQIGETKLVVRRPPLGVLAPGAHDMRREYRVLSRLWQAFDSAPRALLFCADHDVIGADFLVTEYLEGVVFRGGVPAPMAAHPDVVRRAGLAVIDAAADLHAVKPEEVGLAELGRPEGFVQRQLSGWRARWELVAPDEPFASMAEIADRLESSPPAPQRTSLVHSDIKLDNCLFEPAEPDHVKALLDWDMTTLGDPLVDLGTTLCYWTAPGDDGAVGRALWPELEGIGMASRAEVVERYGDRTGLDVSELDWYVAFANWKTAVVLQQLYNRFARGETRDRRMERYGDCARIAAATAERQLSRVGR